MTIAVDLGRKATKQINPTSRLLGMALSLHPFPGSENLSLHLRLTGQICISSKIESKYQIMCFMSNGPFHIELSLLGGC